MANEKPSEAQPPFLIPSSGRVADWRFDAELRGVQARIEFPNGYEASVVRHAYSYGGREGLWERAVCAAGPNGGIVYDTPITDDVIGHLSESEVTALLEQIALLPTREE